MLRTLFFSRWVWSSLVVLVLASTGLASDVGDQGADEQLFIPSAEESSVAPETQPFSDNQTKASLALKADRAVSVGTSSRPRATVASTRRAVLSGDKVEVSGWTWGLTALGGAVVVTVPLCWVFRRKRTSPRFGLMLMSEESPRCARAPSQAFLAANLVRTQQTSDEYAEVLYTERKKLRRAA